MSREITPSNPYLYEARVAGLKWKTALLLTMIISAASLLSMISLTAGFLVILLVPVLFIFSGSREAVAEFISVSVFGRDGIKPSSPEIREIEEGQLIMEFPDCICSAIVVDCDDLTVLPDSGKDAVRRSLKVLIEEVSCTATFLSIPSEPDLLKIPKGDEDYDSLIRYATEDVYYYSTFIILGSRKDKAESGSAQRILQEAVRRSLELVRQTGLRARMANHDDVRNIAKWSP